MENENKKLKKLVVIQQHKVEDGDESDDLSTSSVKEGSSHFQDALEMLKATHLKIVLAIKHDLVGSLTKLDLWNVLLLD